MDFSDFASYPVVANSDYSPTNDAFSYSEPFDKAYIADSYTTSPDHSLASFFDCDSYFDRPLSSVEGPAPSGFASKNPAVFNATLPAATRAPAYPHAQYNSHFDPAPFGQLEQYPAGFAFDGLSNSFDSSVSPQTAHSRTPSLCGDGPNFQACGSPGSPEISPSIPLKRESSDEGAGEEEPMPKRTQRKRGRPRLDSTNSEISSASTKCHRTSRLPHNQVERKYREGINSELERLRRAVPTLPQSEDGGVMGQPKPSKAMVLAGAIDYIKKIEKERDMFRQENDRLRELAQQQGWSKRRADTVPDFLVDP